MKTTMLPVRITLTDKNNVVFLDAEGATQVYKDYDILSMKGDKSFLRVTDRDISGRYMDFYLSELTVIDVKGTTTAYTPVTAREKRTELGRYQTFVKTVVDQLSEEVFIGSITVSGGGGSSTINVLDSVDALLGTLDASVPDNVKLMDASLSYVKVGNQGRVSAPAPATLKPFPIRHARPNSASFYTNDFIYLYNAGVFDFWQYTGDVMLIKVSSTNDFLLDASTPNPFATLFRFTATDGSGPTTPNSAEFSTFGSGETYVVCDWLHRVMWYVANLGNLNFADSMAEVTTQNAANLKGYNDWFVPSIEILLASGYTDHSTFYYSSPNMFQRGAVSGYSEGLMWTCRVAELATTNGMSFYPAYDWRRRGLTSTGQTIYLCRTIKDADIIAMGGTP